MDVQWWRLPGPSRFVQAVIHDLRAGKNIVLGFPPFASDGFREELAQRVRDNDYWRWRVLSAAEHSSDGPEGLATALYRSLLPSLRPTTAKTAVSLASELIGTIIWVENFSLNTWPAWCRFLSQYQHACQSSDPHERSLFCVTAIGSHSSSMMADTALSVRRWEAIVGPLDMALYVDRALSVKFPQPLHQKVARAVITALAGTDVHLANYLLQQDFGSLLEPFDVLTRFAAGRGWNALTQCSIDGLDGTSDIVENSRVLHSAIVAAKGDRSEIRRRIWRGQVAVLFPFIEEQRIKIIPHLSSYVRFPLETTYGRVEKADDLELGQLQYFLRGRRLPQSLWRRLCILTEMRHSIAHMEPVGISSLLAEEILSLTD